MANRAFEFRIYPNRTQKELLARTFGCVRLVYNHYLDRKKQLWEESKQSMSYNACAKEACVIWIPPIRTFSNEKTAAIPDSKAKDGGSSPTPQ